MQGVELKELTKCNEMLTNHVIDYHVQKTIVLLSKYYILKGMSDKEIYNEISQFISQSIADYNKVTWKKIIEDGIANARKIKSINLKDIHEIIITKTEWQNIRNIGKLLKEKDIELSSKDIENVERIAFIMLVYCKILQAKKDDNTISDIYTSTSAILKESRLFGTTKNYKYFYYLYQIGYVIPSSNSNSNHRELKYLAVEDEPLIRITEFENYSVYTYYKEQKEKDAGKVVFYEICQNCHKRFKRKSNCQLYCQSCRK